MKIDKRQLLFTYSRSSGPGGQNVNKVNTRVTLYLDLTNCDALSAGQVRRIRSKLATRIDKNGVLRVICQKHRTQNANRQGAIERLYELLEDALKRRTSRRKTAVPYREKAKRLADKRRRGLQRKLRSQKDFDND